MTKYTEVECDGCGRRQTNIVNNMEYTYMEFVRGPTTPDGDILRHLCDDCALEVYYVIKKRKRQRQRMLINSHYHRIVREERKQSFNQ